MQGSEIKQRKKTADLKQNGEKRNSAAANEDKGRKDAEESKNTGICSQKRWDFRLILSAVSLSVSVIMMWALHRQSGTFVEMKDQYEHLYERLQSQMTTVSDKLQSSIDEYDGILSSATLITKLKHHIVSIQDASTALQEHQETSSLQHETIHRRFHNLSETWQSRLTAATTDLGALKTESRSAHGRVTEHVNDVDRRLHVLSERLQEVEDGIKRNTRVLDRTEDEDAVRVQELEDWNTRRVSKIQEQLGLLAERHDELQKRLEKTVPRSQQWESQLPAVEQSVRSMLKLRAQLAETERRLEELTLQVRRTEERVLKNLSEVFRVQQASVREDDSHTGVSHEPDMVQEEVQELTQLNGQLDSETVGDEPVLREEHDL